MGIEAPTDRGMSVTVLGSGGPFVNPDRASSGLVVRLDGQAKVLVDAGGGTFERLGRAGVDVTSLEAVLLTHTHIDHSGGLAPVVFAMAMAEREWPLAVAGPAGREQHPGCARFCDLLFGPQGA
ncbi:Metallo-beta-lactamase superfamily protein [Modestobacter sp. DSM 44400]|uniref:MBL fold metallo-hydrolase n=1 Tax=Modestobacter sp. DSM 44400 TaxID=1550230 RepID=UPI0008974B0D|nr:MBL fold metallo-hydrolase [Modestobacter sp. DSM 44400]SDX91954.1 Metallo-beta-lactamase superfamily protein [Modestobacter sp. DSM 44400]